ncbi:hypothetical protein KUTeg_020202 [Tegillarca granosa]|uniref:VWFA domain-containing protein n=1 Tax=Tegillarca granosa TaxID=220873 RepID=A0ABQ9ECN1_TEGGR|nr:hypothetical protein KUTeg_020202 [Tegillarca granosa]
MLEHDSAFPQLKMATLLPSVGSFEICFSFDTTGSMSSCIEEVKGRLQDMIQRLQADIPGIRIAVFAHGDYCDKKSTYITKHIDFTTNVADLCTWVKGVGETFGGDADECYELVLHEVQQLSWTPGSRRALVLIGDANPHEPSYEMNEKNLDWRIEADILAKMGVRIYSVQCSADTEIDQFYKTIADKTDGKRLKLAEFTNIFDFIMAICYREQGQEFLNMYEDEVRGRNSQIHKDVASMFGDLKDDEMDTSKPAMAKIPSLTKSSSSVKLKKAIARPKVTKVTKTKTSIITKNKHTEVTKSSAKTSMERKIRNKRSKIQKIRLPKLRRENVPETSFMLKDKKWSQWELVISPTIPLTEAADTWEKRKSKIESYRRKIVFRNKNSKPAFYEFSVQAGQDSKKFVLYCRFSKGFLPQQSWESRLLGKNNIRNQINDVILKGCSVSIRRLILRSQSKDVSSALRRYDYAWRRMRPIRKTHFQTTYQ